MNRKFIGIDIDNQLMEMVKTRFLKVGEYDKEAIVKEKILLK